ncbi:MAG: ABC transporter ATP-binding protein [archaeon]
MTSPILKIENLKRNFGRKEVLKGISLDINEGEIFGIIGMSGSGKSVLLKTIVHFWKPTSGKVTYKNSDTKKFGFRKQFGFSTQESCFYPELSVQENLMHYGRLYGLKRKEIKERIKNLLAMLELEGCAKQTASELSGGMQKRLDIACSLVHKPKLLLLDEPTVELDPILRREVMNLIHKINKEEKVTILMASHLLGGIEAMCSNIAILHEGKAVKIGNPTKLREEYGKHEEIHIRLASNNCGKIAKLLEQKKRVLGIDSITANSILTIYCSDAEKILPQILGILKGMKEKIIDLHVSKPSLTEVFTSIIKEHRNPEKKGR